MKKPLIYNKFLCLGDSITYGSRDEYNRAWPFELADMMWKEYHHYWIPIIRAEPGLTTAGLLRKVYDWTSGEKVYKVIILIGTNDSKPKIATPIDIFRKNYEGILRTIQVQQPDAFIFLCTLPDIRFGSPDYNDTSEELIIEYNKVIIDIAKNHYLIDLRGLPHDVYADSVHFLNAGSVAIARRVFNVIRENFFNW